MFRKTAIQLQILSLFVFLLQLPFSLLRIEKLAKLIIKNKEFFFKKDSFTVMAVYTRGVIQLNCYSFLFTREIIFLFVVKLFFTRKYIKIIFFFIF